jgi:hypothetical protein
MGRWVLLGVVLLAGRTALAEGESGAPRLPGLDAQLNATGRIADIAPQTASSIETTQPTDLKAGAGDRAPGDALNRALATSARSREQTAGLAEEFRPTDSKVASCRIEVARRRQVLPSKVTAESVVVRFTVEASGRVHDAEAVWVTATDPEVAACAKRVVSSWTFPKRLAGPTTVERTYHF